MNWVNCFAFLALKMCGSGLLLTVSCLILFGLPPAYANPSSSVRVAIVVSRHISPYLEAVEGLEAGLADTSDVKTQVFNLEKLDEKERVERFAGEGVKEFALFVAVGPEAAQYLWKGIGKTDASRTYCMVLNPEKVINERERRCGIPLNIPVKTQIEMIRRGFPSAGRVGLLYDPEHNAEFLHKATVAASVLDLTVVPISVSSKKDIPSALERQWNHLDALWLIPDRTIISESIVKYLIKKAFLRKVPVVGYNRFFYEAGAALAFVFDYNELGQQCAHNALRILAGEDCRDTPPVFHVWVNETVAEKLGHRPPDGYPPPLELGP
ncbi:MAG: hypothetical protein K9N21_07910 [Deltaproteobacteria bacterium]|nr:hypothetical protein [Deltaproteobacteria bacterium]